MSEMLASLKKFGADSASVHLFAKDGPSLLPYATLVTARRNEHTILGAVEGVYEWQGAPLLYFVSAKSLQDSEQLHRLRRLLAMRGDAPYLGVVSPGRLDVYRIALDKKTPSEVRVDLDMAAGAQAATLAYLSNLRPNGTISPRDWISNVVLSLLTNSISRLIGMKGVSNEDAISLVGRALFTRFLADRNLLPREMSDAGSAASLFDHRSAAEKTSRWLDGTFNGDLLPLSNGIFDILPAGAYQVLGAILRRAPDGQLFLGWEQKWNHLDFAHIPVGVLSQAYELYLRSHAPAKQRKEGGYYTPRLIADLMVRASFRALDREAKGCGAKVLDPSAGAGVFLLTAFRELIADRWRVDKRRPDTKTLRSILYSQLAGFDINEAALRFAALGLYLMSIELDPQPKPVDKLRFENLRGRVLFKMSSATSSEGSELGSLGPLVGDEHLGQYDLVVGNPPWASSTKLPDWHLVRSTVARIANLRTATRDSPPLPNEGLDLPFVWRAMEWAKANGQIAFALHARLLFQQGDGMAQAREALFSALNITSIINGVELRQTKVWPEITAPFCIVFATNTTPDSASGFRLISPRLEQSLNDAGSMRIDTGNAEVVPLTRLSEVPDILKILFRGTSADLGVIERLRSMGHPTLEKFWREAIGTEHGHLLGSGNGYQKLRPSSPTNADGLPGEDAGDLCGFPEVTAESFRAVTIDHTQLLLFDQERVHRSRSSKIFRSPLVLVHQSPPVRTGRVGVAVSEKTLIFNETFYGYSASGFEDADTLVRYLALVFGSNLVLWMALLTSGKFGFEREVIEKATLDRMPIPDFRAFSSSFRAEINRRYKGLQEGRIDWTEIDRWVCKLYGLGERDLQVIADTLDFSLPFADNKKRAQELPSSSELKVFCDVLKEELTPWCKRFESSVEIASILQPNTTPWFALDLRTSRSSLAETFPVSDWQGLLVAASETAASEVIVHKGPDELLIGRLAQRRYWTKTQARLLAQRIVWSHIDVLKGQVDA